MSPEPPWPYAKDRVPAGATPGCGTGVRGDGGLTSWELGLPAHLGFSFLYLVKKGKKERNIYYKHDQRHLGTVWTVVTHILIVLLFSGLLRRFRAKGVRQGSQPVSTPGRSAL